MQSIICGKPLIVKMQSHAPQSRYTGQRLLEKITHNACGMQSLIAMSQVMSKNVSPVHHAATRYKEMIGVHFPHPNVGCNEGDRNSLGRSRIEVIAFGEQLGPSSHKTSMAKV